MSRVTFSIWDMVLWSELLRRTLATSLSTIESTICINRTDILQAYIYFMRRIHLPTYHVSHLICYLPFSQPCEYLICSAFVLDVSVFSFCTNHPPSLPFTALAFLPLDSIKVITLIFTGSTFTGLVFTGFHRSHFTSFHWIAFHWIAFHLLSFSFQWIDSLQSHLICFALFINIHQMSL